MNDHATERLTGSAPAEPERLTGAADGEAELVDEERVVDADDEERSE